MAEAQCVFQPPLNVIYKIIQFMKKFYKTEPGAETRHMIKKVFCRLQMQMYMDELQFRQFVSRMIDPYLDICRRLGNPNMFNDPQNGWVTVECTYFMELNEALQLSHYYRRIVMGPDSQPTTSSAYNNSTLGQHSQWTPRAVGAELRSMAKAPDLTLRSHQQPPTPGQARGRYVSIDDYETNIGSHMKAYFKENRDSYSIKMTMALHMEVDPKEDFDIFKSCVNGMISQYLLVRRAQANPFFSQAQKANQLSSCPYYYDVHQALRYTTRYRHITNPRFVSSST